MNQTKKHTTGKKLLALLLALIMTVSLLPMSVFAAEPGTEETPVVEDQAQQDTEPVQEPDADEANEDEAPVDEGEDTALPGDAEGDADDADAADDGIAAFAATDATVQYKILHLDCGRKYFSKEWIIALLNEMSAAGYNQLQLAFGNKGLRFLLEDMSVTVDGKTYGNKEVTKAIQAGNKAYYDAREKNELTQTEMDAILAKAKELKIDIVPLFNTPFHMEAVITAMQQLDMTDVYYSEKGCLNLNNDAAKEFVTALMQKYVNYFAKRNCNFFNFGADEYKGGWNTTFYNYADSIAKMISTAGMTARVFNDSFRGDSWNNGALVTTNGSIGKDYLDGVCYWYTGYKSYTDDTLYASASALNTEGYGLINTNKVYYYVVSAEKMYEWGSKTAVQYVFSGTYNEAEWIDHAKGFSNTTYNNWAGTNNGTGPAPIGSMFCVWSDNPGDKTETQIAQEIRMILRVMAARMDNKTTYSSSDVIVTGGFNADGTINGGSGGGTEPETPVIKQDDTTVSGSKVQVAMGATTTLTLSGNKTATWSSSDEKILKLEAVSSKTRAAVAGTNAVQVVPVATGTATVTAKLDDGAELSTEVTVTAAPEPTTVDVTLKVGETKSIPYKTADYPVWGKYKINTTAAGYDNTIANVTVSYETKDKTPVKAESITSGESYYIMDDTGKVFLTTESGKVTATIDVNKATKWKITAITDSYNDITGYKIQAQVTGTYANYYLTGTSTQSLLLTSNFVDATVAQSSNWFCSKGLYYQLKSTTIGEAYGRLQYVLYDSTSSKWSVGWDSSNVVFYETTADQTNISFEGIKTGTTKVKVSDVTYNITVTQQKVVPVELEIGQTSDVFVGAEGATITASGDTSIATANVQPVNVPGKTTRTLGDILTTYNTGSYEGVIAYKEGTDKYHYMKLLVVNGKADITDTTKIDEATVFTFNKTYSGCTIQAKDSNYYVAMKSSYGYYGYTYTLTAQSSSYTWSVGYGNDFYKSSSVLSYYNGSWTITTNNWDVAGKGYKVEETPTTGKKATNITFTGVKPGNTTYVIDDVTYVVTVKAKEVPVTLEVGDRVTFDVGNDRISESPNTDIAKAELDGKGTLTLTGVAVGGPTYCTVGDTRYVITVVEKSSAAGTLLYVDLWVTNHGVLPDGDGLEFANNSGTGTGNRRVTVQYEASKFASPDGQLLSDVLPNAGTDTVNSQTARYWKTRYLPLSTRQKTEAWTNKSGYGTDVLSGEAGGMDIERIRYYGGKWSYLPVDGTEWIDFNTNNDSKVTLEETGVQIAAYYMLKTTVTKEVTTYITDWPDPHKTSDAIYGVALDYCVKYLGDNVTRYPSEFGNANENTHWFNCKGESPSDAYTNGYTVASTDEAAANWTGLGTSEWYRVINNIEAVDTDQYEVYMITATPGDQFTDGVKGYTQCPDTITYPATGEKVIWAIDDQAVTDSGLDKHAELVVGGAPRVDRVVIQQCTGLLLTYYVRAKASVDNLHVNYYDKDSGLLIHTYDIIPSTTQEPNNFAGFQWNNANLNAGFATGTDYVYNNEGKKVTVQTDLTKVSGIAGKYQVGFALVEINKTDDNKTLNLYYKLDNSRTYVVDFGVPAKVERWGVNDFTKISVEETTLYENGATTKKEVSKTNGKLYVDSKGDLYYQLTTMQYKNPDTFNVTYTYQDTGTSTGTTDNSNTYTVTFIPASNVYYEDDDAFITFAGGQGKADAAQWEVELDKGKTAADESKQIAEVLSKAKNVYGRDPTYENSTMFSLGRAHKVTVSADMVNNWNENSDAWPTAQFTFKGTGFDVISLTDNKSGLLTYKVEKLETDGTWTIERQRFVSNYYDYGFKNGEWTNVESTDENALYQLPVVKVDGLTYGTYRVTLIVAYGELFDKTGNKEYSFWLDGVRIYDPAGPDLNNTYANDGEGWPKYIELHDELVKNDKNATTLFIEGDAQADIKAYTSYGPNHEVYLLNEQILAFKLANTAKVDKIHIGAKAPMGHATLKVNGQVIEPAIRTATDMYYDITKLVKDDGTVIITNADTAGDSILSLTQLKVTYTAEPTETGLASLAILTETEKQQVVQMVRAMYAPVEPEVFTPERFEASWNRSTVKVGQRATLTVKTSTDVDVITVDGVTVTNYRTRTQRTGWGWNATKVTYREFTYTITATEAGTLDYSVVAVNADGVSSEPITAALTVQAVQRPQRPSWLDKIFSRWF